MYVTINISYSIVKMYVTINISYSIVKIVTNLVEFFLHHIDGSRVARDTVHPGNLQATSLNYLGAQFNYHGHKLSENIQDLLNLVKNKSITILILQDSLNFVKIAL